MDKPPILPLSKDWKLVLEKDFRFKIVQKMSNIPPNMLWTTSCSKTKTGNNTGIPSTFYLGKYNKIFYKLMHEHKLPYGVLSDKYGIHMYDEKLKYYDIHPSKLSLNDKQKLGNLIQKKVKKNGFEGIIFYYPSPLLSKPYFDILWFSQLPIFYISSIFKIFD